MKLFLFLFLFLESCQFLPFLQNINDSYSSKIQKTLKETNIYEAFNTTYSIKTLYLNQKHTQNSLKLRLQSVAASDTTNHKQLLTGKNYVIFFVSLYTSTFNYKNLRNQKIWNIFLKNNNQKYSAKILASPFIAEQTRFLFPFHNTFSKGFFVKFDLNPSQLSPSATLHFYSFLGNSSITNFTKN